MIVCVCNALNERAISNAIKTGASSVARVYKEHGCKAQCGKCTCQIRDMIRSQKSD